MNNLKGRVAATRGGKRSFPVDVEWMKKKAEVQK